MGGPGTGSAHWPADKRQAANERMRAAWTPERRAAQAERARRNKPHAKLIGVPLASEVKEALRAKQAEFWTLERRREWSARTAAWWNSPQGQRLASLWSAAWTPERRREQSARTTRRYATGAT